MIEDKVEVVAKDYICNINTTSEIVLCGDINVNDYINTLKYYSKNMISVKKFFKVVYVDNLKRIYFNTLEGIDIRYDDITSIYLNGYVLLKDKDFFFIDNEYISINVTTFVNDIFTIETVRPVKNIKTNNIIGSMSEKTKINDIINKFNQYVFFSKKMR